MRGRRTRWRWRTEILVVLGVLLLVVALLVATLRGTDFGYYSDDINAMTMECRARAKTHPKEDCGHCCFALQRPDIKSHVWGEDGIFGCTCTAR